MNSREFKKKYNSEEHIKTEDSENILEYVCYMWPECKSAHKFDSLYSSEPNLRVHLINHHKDHTFDESRVRTIFVNKVSIVLIIIKPIKLLFRN